MTVETILKVEGDGKEESQRSCKVLPFLHMQDFRWPYILFGALHLKRDVT